MTRINPTKKSIKDAERNEAIKRLREVMKNGDTVYTNLNSVGKSGMVRHIEVLTIKNNRPANWTHLVAIALDMKYQRERNNRLGLRVGGCGMDMGFHVVNHLSNVLFDSDYALKQEWI